MLCVHDRLCSQFPHLTMAPQDDKGVGLRGTQTRQGPCCRLLSVAAVGGGLWVGHLDVEAGLAVGQPRLDTSPSLWAAGDHGQVGRDVSAKGRFENGRRILQAGYLLLGRSRSRRRPLPLRRIRLRIPRHRSVLCRLLRRPLRLLVRRRLRRRCQICVFQIR
jgi:hypothetical protein